MPAEPPTQAIVDALFATLDQRGTVRRFQDTPIPASTFQRLLRAGQRAPTDATGQLYSIVRVVDPALRERLATLCADQPQVREAAEFLVYCLDVRRLRRLLEHRGETYGMGGRVALLFGITDAALAAQTTVVVAETMGYGACYIGAVQNHPDDVVEALGLPEGVVPLWGLCLGAPVFEPVARPRLPLRLVLHEDRYEDAPADDLDRAYATMASATRSGDWLNVLRKYFGGEGHMARREGRFRGLLEGQGVD